jgi:hypothetical protein
MLRWGIYKTGCVFQPCQSGLPDMWQDLGQVCTPQALEYVLNIPLCIGIAGWLVSNDHPELNNWTFQLPSNPLWQVPEVKNFLPSALLQPVDQSQPSLLPVLEHWWTVSTNLGLPSYIVVVCALLLQLPPVIAHVSQGKCIFAHLLANRLSASWNSLPLRCNFTGAAGALECSVVWVL